MIKEKVEYDVSIHVLESNRLFTLMKLPIAIEGKADELKRIIVSFLKLGE